MNRRDVVLRLTLIVALFVLQLYLTLPGGLGLTGWAMEFAAGARLH